jgi:hypothetical protein
MQIITFESQISQISSLIYFKYQNKFYKATIMIGNKTRPERPVEGGKKVALILQSCSVITNSSGPAIFCSQ